MTPSPAVWAAVGLFAWAVAAAAVGAEAAPPPGVLVVVVLAIALAAAANRRMRSTGRLLLILLSVVFATAALVAGLSWVTAVDLVLSVTTGLLALFELIPDRRRA